MTTNTKTQDLKQILALKGITVTGAETHKQKIIILETLISSEYCVESILEDNKYFSSITASDLVNLMHQYLEDKQPAKISIILQSSIVQDYLKNNSFATAEVISHALKMNNPGVIKAIMECAKKSLSNQPDLVFDLLENSNKLSGGALSALLSKDINNPATNSLIAKFEKIGKPEFILKFLETAHEEVISLVHSQAKTLFMKAINFIDVGKLIELFKSNNNDLLEYLNDRRLISDKVAALVEEVKNSASSPQALKPILEVIISIPESSSKIFFEGMSSIKTTHDSGNASKEFLSIIGNYAAKLNSVDKIHLLKTCAPSTLEQMIDSSYDFKESLSSLGYKPFIKVISDIASKHGMSQSIKVMLEKSPLGDFQITDEDKIEIIARISKEKDSVYLLKNLESLNFMKISPEEISTKSEALLVMTVKDLLLSGQFGSAGMITKTLPKLFKDDPDVDEDRGEKNLKTISDGILHDTQAKCVFHMHKDFADLFPSHASGKASEYQVTTFYSHPFVERIESQCEFYKKVAKKDDFSLELFGTVYTDIDCKEIGTLTEEQEKVFTKQPDADKAVPAPTWPGHAATATFGSVFVGCLTWGATIHSATQKASDLHTLQNIMRNNGIKSHTTLAKALDITQHSDIGSKHIEAFNSGILEAEKNIYLASTCAIVSGIAAIGSFLIQDNINIFASSFDNSKKVLSDSSATEDSFTQGIASKTAETADVDAMGNIHTDY